MKKFKGTNRRNFMKGAAGVTALLSAAGTSSALAMGQSRGGSSKGYDFDEIYSRIGVNSVKWDNGRVSKSTVSSKYVQRV